MEDYIRARPDIFFTGPDGSLRSNRAFCQTAGLYACDMFIGSTLQIDLQGNSSTATARPHRRLRRRAEHGRRCARPPPCRAPAWLKAGAEARPEAAAPMPRGRKLVVQIGRDLPRAHAAGVRRTARRAGSSPSKLGLELPPVMIYGDDVTHIVTEEGIANLLLCRNAGGARAGDPRRRRLHRRRPRPRPEDGREPARARRHPAAGGSRHRYATRDARPARGAHHKDLVRASGGLYDPPARFRSW